MVTWKDAWKRSYEFRNKYSQLGNIIGLVSALLILTIILYSFSIFEKNIDYLLYLWIAILISIVCGLYIQKKFYDYLESRGIR